MSVAGISSSLFSYLSQSVHSKGGSLKQEFQQLGQDLQSGDLSAAQADFTSLQQLQTQSSSSSSSSSSSNVPPNAIPASSTNSIAQEFQQLAQDLQSGNLSGAQQDYSTIQQSFQSSGVQAHHHHHRGGGPQNTTQQQNTTQLFQQLGQELQAGDLGAAQQAYTTLQQEFGLTTGSS